LKPNDDAEALSDFKVATVQHCFGLVDGFPYEAHVIRRIEAI